MMDINKEAKRVYEQNKSVGWWDDPDRPVASIMMLVVTEISEAAEGVRKDLNDDKLPDRPMAEVELADTLIRLLDFGGRYDLQYVERCDHKLKATHRDHIRHDHPLVNLYGLVRGVVMLCDDWYGQGSRDSVSRLYSELIDAIYTVADVKGYDLQGAYTEKLEFNKTRADHKRENREKQNGKKY